MQITTGSNDFCLRMQDSSEKYNIWQENIYNKFLSNFRSDVWYAVIDPNTYENLPEILWSIDDNPDIWPLFMNTMNHETMLHGPLFLRMQKKSMRWFLEKCREYPIGVLYYVESENVNVLFEHLQNLVECILPNDKIGIFRFYDPRILYAIHKCAGENLDAMLAGPSKMLCSWETGHEKSIEIFGQGYILKEEWFLLEQNILDKVSLYTTPYSIINNMRGERGEILRSLPLLQSFTLVREICASLFSLGITDIHGCTVGTSFSMQAGHNIFEDEVVRSAIQKKSDEHSLIDILRCLPDTCFQKTLPQE